ncbi:hypothetical protein CZ771_04965 [Actinomycetales bacterium JB111]|nr:hypothetical protein CZ771_04965 [Actinomycetales bacterium JB111]
MLLPHDLGESLRAVPAVQGCRHGPDTNGPRRRRARPAAATRDDLWVNRPSTGPAAARVRA